MYKASKEFGVDDAVRERTGIYAFGFGGQGRRDGRDHARRDHPDGGAVRRRARPEGRSDDHDLLAATGVVLLLPVRAAARGQAAGARVRGDDRHSDRLPAIAIYETAVDRTPAEDFYYLFLGRAYLERAAITEDASTQTDLLQRAESLLLQAQQLNPLNTDHTANLARLNTRWYAAVNDESERLERLNLADQYYQLALTLSPQNSIIRNEHARLVLDVMGDCDRALAIFDQAAAIDPFYTQTHLARADAYILCAGGRPEAERDEFYRTAASSLDMALGLDPRNVRAWIQLAEIHQQLGEFELAFTAAENARLQNEPAIIPMAEIDFLAAQIAAGMGNLTEARSLAERAQASQGLF